MKIDDNLLFSMEDSFIYEYIDVASAILTRIKSTSYYSDSIAKEIEDRVWISVIQLLINYSSKISNENPIFKHQTNAGLFKIEHKRTNSLKGVKYALNSDKRVFLKFPDKLLENSESKNVYDSVKILSISWYLIPSRVSSSNSNTLSSDSISVFLLSRFREIIDLKDTPAVVLIPYLKIWTLNSIELWVQWSYDFYRNIKFEKLWELSSLNTTTPLFHNWINWMNETILEIKASFQSTFAIQTSLNQSKG